MSGLGDRVEHHAADGGVFLDRLALAQGLFKMPANRLAFAVGVGCEDQGVVVFQGVGNGFDMLFAVACDLPKHVEIGVRVDRAVFRGQVADVTVGCQDCIVGPQILVDCLGLSRRFNDDNRHENPFTQHMSNGRAKCGWGGRIVNAAIDYL